MAIFSFSDFQVCLRKNGKAILAFSVCLGQLLGIGFVCGAGEPYFSGMRAVVSSPVSLTGLLSSLVAPFLFSAFAVYVKRPALLIPIAFVKAFVFASVGCGFLIAWGSAGWLVGGLMLFGTVCAMPLLCWYWLRYMTGRCFEPLVFCVVLAALVGIGILNNELIVPFLARITTFYG